MSVQRCCWFLVREEEEKSTGGFSGGREGKFQRDNIFTQGPGWEGGNWLLLAKPWSLEKDWAEDPERGSSPSEGDADGFVEQFLGRRQVVLNTLAVNPTHSFLFTLS